jgi:hypothetical protein
MLPCLPPSNAIYIHPGKLHTMSHGERLGLLLFADCAQCCGESSLDMASAMYNDPGMTRFYLHAPVMYYWDWRRNKILNPACYALGGAAVKVQFS